MRGASRALPTARCGQRGSRGPSARGCVVGPQTRGARGGSQGGPRAGRHTRTPRSHGGQPAGEAAEAAPGTGSARPAAPLPAPRPRPSARRRPARRYSLAARSAAGAAAAPPAPRPLLAPDSAPDVLPGPARPRAPLPQGPPVSARRGRREPGSCEPGAGARQEGRPGRTGGGKSAAEGGGSDGLRYANSRADGVGRPAHGAPDTRTWPSGGRS